MVGFLDMNLRDTGGVPRMEDLVPIWKPDREYKLIRIVGDVSAYSMWWLPVETKEGKSVRVPRVALEDEGTDPYSKIEGAQKSTHFYFNAFVREENNKLMVVRVPISVARELKKLSEMNKHGKGAKRKDFPLSDPDYGAEIHIRYDASAPGATKYGVQKGDHAPLTKKERKRTLHELEGLLKPLKRKEAEKDAAELMDRGKKEEKDAEAKPGKSKKGKHGKGDKRKGRKSK